jgi:dTDP-4-amino-4,6-dideoxygalactose transaminase
MNVPVLDLKRQYEAIRAEMDAAILDVVGSTKFVLGPYVADFEEKAAAYCEVRHAIGVASGTDALLLSLRALGIGPGDAVILPSFTFFATAGVVHNVGATPVFCDIDPRTFNLDVDHVRELLRDPEVTSKAKAIIPVHLYGQISDMDEVLAIAKEHGLAVVEDAAQAIGAACDMPNGLAKAGTIGDLGCFSFYPTKNLGAYGDAGMVITNDDDLADAVRMLRVHGARPKYFHRMVGVNSRLDAIQAAVLAVKLAYLDRWSAAREERAGTYDAELSGLDGIVVPHRADDRTHIFHQYTIRVLDGRRDALAEHLKERGVGTMIYYPKPLHLQECFAGLGYEEGQLPRSEAASREVLSLPIFPELTAAEQSYVVESIRGFMERGS